MSTVHHRKSPLLFIPVLLSLAACSSLGSRPTTLAEHLEHQGYRQTSTTVDAIPAYTISALIALDAEHVELYATGDQRYLLELANICPSLSISSELGYTRTAGSLTKYDKIILKDSPGLQSVCQIKTIYKLESVKK